MTHEKKRRKESPMSGDDEMLRQYYGGSSLSEEQVARMRQASNRETPQLRAKTRGLIEGMLRDTAREHGKDFEAETSKFIAIHKELLSVCDEINKRMDSINPLISELNGVFDPKTAERINSGLADYEKLRKEMDKLLEGENAEKIVASGDVRAMARYCSKLSSCTEKAKKALAIVEPIYALIAKSH